MERDMLFARATRWRRRCGERARQQRQRLPRPRATRPAHPSRRAAAEQHREIARSAHLLPLSRLAVGIMAEEKAAAASNHVINVLKSDMNEEMIAEIIKITGASPAAFHYHWSVGDSTARPPDARTATFSDTLPSSARPRAVFDKHKLHKDVATAVKQAFDLKYPPADNKATSGVYHCIVGSDFAVSVTHETHFSCFWR
eukprot:7116618-Prymnesium_polylepis.2